MNTFTIVFIIAEVICLSGMLWSMFINNELFDAWIQFTIGSWGFKIWNIFIFFAILLLVIVESYYFSIYL